LASLHPHGVILARARGCVLAIQPERSRRVGQLAWRRHPHLHLGGPGILGTHRSIRGKQQPLVRAGEGGEGGLRPHVSYVTLFCPPVRVSCFCPLSKPCLVSTPKQRATRSLCKEHLVRGIGQTNSATSPCWRTATTVLACCGPCAAGSTTGTSLRWRTSTPDKSRRSSSTSRVFWMRRGCRR